MKRKTVRALTFLMTLMITTSSFSGCGNKSKDQSQQSGTASTSNEVIDKLTLPIVDKPITLKWWRAIGSASLDWVKNYGESPTYIELQKRTGINIQFIHPPVGQENEQFNIMVASNELPDIITRDLVTTYTGGPEKAIADGLIIQVNDLIAKYSPNLRNTLKKFPQQDKMIKTDSSKYYCYPSLRPYESTLVYVGFGLRQDWLDELGLSVPTTISEWYNVLKVLKDKKSLTAPLVIQKADLSSSWSIFSGAFGVGSKFYLSDKGTKIKYGPYEPAFKEYLETMNKWYKEGLLDPDFATNDKKALDSKITGEKSGAFYAYHSWMSNYQIQVRPTNPKFTIVGAPSPVKNKGDVPMFGYRASEFIPSASAYITPSNKYPKETAMLLDYGYSEEGNLLYNFGVEGDSYSMVNGYPKYDDKILNNPKGIAALNKYIFTGPFVTDPKYFEQTLISKEQADGIKVASQTKSVETTVPPITPSEGDAKKLASMSNDVTTYTDEMVLKFIIGQEPLSNYDKFIAQLKNLGIEDVIKIRQKALEAYNKR